MSIKIEAQRSQGSYDLAWDHLNEHLPLGFTAKVVAGKTHYDDLGERGEQWIYITTSRPATLREISDFAISTFSRHCRCEHDCCGHWQVTPSTFRAKSNKRGTRWEVPLRSYLNI